MQQPRSNDGQTPDGSVASFFLRPRSGSGDSSNASPERFFAEIQTTANPEFREYYINLAVMRHFLAHLPADNRDVRKALIVRAVGYLYNYASLLNGANLGWQGNPIQQGERIYARSLREPRVISLIRNFRDAIAKDLGLPPGNLQLSTDSGILNVVKEHLVSREWRDSSEISEIVGQVGSGNGSRLFLDISENLAQMAEELSKNPDRIGPSINTFQQLIRAKIHREVEREVNRNFSEGSPEDHETKIKKLMEGVDEQLIVGGMLDVGNQPVLYTGKLAAPGNTLNGEWLPSTEPRPIDSKQGSIFATLIDDSGFTPDPVHLLENWADLTGEIEPILRVLQLEEREVTFPTDRSSLEIFKDVSEFLHHPTVKAFDNLSASVNGEALPPHLAILPKATIKLLRGLKDMGVDERFKQNGLEKLLQFSYNRMLAHMQNGMAAKDDFRRWQNYIHLVHEELGTILAIAKPHHSVDLELQSVTNFLPEVFASGARQSHHLKESGMRCLEAIVTACEELNRPTTGANRGLSVAAQQDIYFSSAFLLAQRRNHQVFYYQGEKVGWEADLKADMPGDGAKLDLLVAEFHHNIVKRSKLKYKIEDLIAQVDRLFEAGLVSERFTVAIDDTIGTTDGKEVQNFLHHNQDRIRKGQLNVVVYRSACKFDYLGMNACNAGIMMVVNHPDQFAAFNESVTGKAGRISNIVSQWTIHYQKFIQSELNERRRAIMRAAERLGSPESPIGFPQWMFEQEGRSILSIAPSSDPLLPFLDLRLDSIARGLAREFLALFERLAADTPYSRYPSFGLNRASMNAIPDFALAATLEEQFEQFRFTPGLEDEATLRVYRDYLKILNQILREPGIDYPNDSELQRTIVERLLRPNAYELSKLKEQIDRGVKDPSLRSHGHEVSVLKAQIKKGVEDPHHPLTNLKLAQAYLRAWNPRRASIYLRRAQDSLESVQMADAWRNALEKSALRIGKDIEKLSGRKNLPIESFRVEASMTGNSRRSTSHGASI